MKLYITISPKEAETLGGIHKAKQIFGPEIDVVINNPINKRMKKILERKRKLR